MTEETTLQNTKNGSQSSTKAIGATQGLAGAARQRRGTTDTRAVAAKAVPRSATRSSRSYDTWLPAWLRARDVLAGEDAVKGGGEKYLPRLDSQSSEEFASYVRRASFFNATARTAEAYLGPIFRRPPFLKTPEVRGQRSEGSGIKSAVADFVNDVDMLGTTLTGYAKMVVGDVVGIGRAGSLVDWEDNAELIVCLEQNTKVLEECRDQLRLSGKLRGRR